jgi:dolichyl-phosphate beta-glucosyltransferase
VEIVIVDDGSSDDTLGTAREVYGHLEHVIAVRQEPNMGKGAAVRLGMGLARGEGVLVSDADMAISPRHFPDLIGALENVDIAPGSRVEGRRVRYDSLVRNLASDAFHFLVQHYTGLTLRDTQCGAKAFRAGPARLLALLCTTDGFAYDAEMLSLAQRLGLSLAPVAVTWDDVKGSSVNVGSDSLKMVRDLRRLSRHHYENPVVEVAREIELGDVARAAREVRAHGLVLARGEANALVVLARDGALSGAGIAAALHGRLRTTSLDELRGRELVAV